MSLGLMSYLGGPASAVDYHELLLDRFRRGSLRTASTLCESKVYRWPETVIVGKDVSDQYSLTHIL
jgi:hypothetical protein